MIESPHVRFRLESQFFRFFALVLRLCLCYILLPPLLVNRRRHIAHEVRGADLLSRPSGQLRRRTAHLGLVARWLHLFFVFISRVWLIGVHAVQPQRPELALDSDMVTRVHVENALLLVVGAAIFPVSCLLAFVGKLNRGVSLTGDDEQYIVKILRNDNLVFLLIEKRIEIIDFCLLNLGCLRLQEPKVKHHFSDLIVIERMIL